MREGTITLAAAPQPGSVVWAADYTYYARPACGSTVMQCFYSMPQHPVPFPNWIAASVVPYFTHYPITDQRNIVRGVLYTTAGTVSALLLGGAFGVLLAALFVFLRPLEQALLPWVIASQTVPIIALVPVLLLVLGNVGITVQTSLIPTALIGAYIAFFPVTVGIVTGLRSVDPLALDLMKSYEASPFQEFLRVRFPAAVPFLFTSLKLGTAAALVGCWGRRRSPKTAAGSATPWSARRGGQRSRPVDPAPDLRGARDRPGGAGRRGAAPHGARGSAMSRPARPRRARPRPAPAVARRRRAGAGGWRAPSARDAAGGPDALADLGPWAAVAAVGCAPVALATRPPTSAAVLRRSRWLGVFLSTLASGAGGPGAGVLAAFWGFVVGVAGGPGRVEPDVAGA